MYEQDWMGAEYNMVEALQTNLTLADLWLQGMADGAEGSGRTVQYCMPYANDVLAAASHAAVTNARATGDYFHAHNQWAIGGTALFYWAINVLPFKDGFYSSNLKQVGGQTEGPETHPDREALMATLSGAMVGAMDGINLLNASRVMTTCTKDGTVLKPDRPVTTTDWCFTKADPACFVYATHSDIPGFGRATYHFNNRDTYDTLEAGMVGLSDAFDIGTYAVYNWYTQELAAMKPSQTLAVGYEGHVYAVITPVLAHTWVFLGETDKYVTHAKMRFKKASATVEYLSVDVIGVAGETVLICAAKIADMLPTCKRVTFDDFKSSKNTRTVTFA